MKLDLGAALVWPWVKKHWFISGLALLIGSCAFMMRDRVVEWEEEVPLNTGETIWVKRSMPWVYPLCQTSCRLLFSTRMIRWTDKYETYTAFPRIQRASVAQVA